MVHCLGPPPLRRDGAGGDARLEKRDSRRGHERYGALVEMPHHERFGAGLLQAGGVRFQLVRRQLALSQVSGLQLQRDLARSVPHTA